MKKFLILLSEYFIVKIVLALYYVIYFKKSFFDSLYVCNNSGEEYMCNLINFSFNSTLGTIGDWIAIFVIFITIMAYLTYIAIKHFMKNGKK